jgi:hypothetical protein
VKNFVKVLGRDPEPLSDGKEPQKIFKGGKKFPDEHISKLETVSAKFIAVT